MVWNGKRTHRPSGTLSQELISGENDINILHCYIEENRVKERAAHLHLMHELAKGRRSGEEDGWISSENVRNHFRARVK